MASGIGALEADDLIERKLQRSGQLHEAMVPMRLKVCASSHLCSDFLIVAPPDIPNSDDRITSPLFDVYGHSEPWLGRDSSGPVHHNASVPDMGNPRR